MVSMNYSNEIIETIIDIGTASSLTLGGGFKTPEGPRHGKD
jgi:hypothetical protein